MTLTDTLTLFGWQFLTGLMLALFVPLTGLFLRLRDEWLAALGLTHVAAAGGVASVVLGWPVLAVALLAGGAAAVLKWRLHQPGNSVYAVMILAGWALVLLIAANHPHAQLLGQALVDGQLYYTGIAHVVIALLLVVGGGSLLSWLSPRLQREILFPGHQAGNGEAVRRYHLAFDLLAVATVAIAALAVGIMAAFALVLLPAWTAFGIARDWRAAARIAAAVGIGGYCLAFAIAIVFDQPFGPVLVAVLLALCSLRLLKTKGSDPFGA